MNCCCPNCGTQIVVNVPGLQGNPGNNGINAFSLLSNVTFGAKGSSATVTVSTNQWMAVGQHVFVSDGGSNFATMQITSFPAGTNQFTGTFQGYTGDAVSGTVTTGTVSPGGYMPALPVSVANGGTGVATLTGIVFGNGASNMTAANITGIVLANGASAPTALSYQTGTLTLVAGVATVNTVITLTANSVILFCLKTKGGGALTGALYLSGTPTTGGPGTASFSVASGGTTDTGTYNFIIIN